MNKGLPEHVKRVGELRARKQFRKHYLDALRTMRRRGYSVRYIAAMTGHSEDVIRKWTRGVKGGKA